MNKLNPEEQKVTPGALDPGKVGGCCGKPNLEPGTSSNTEGDSESESSSETQTCCQKFTCGLSTFLSDKYNSMDADT